MLINEVVVKEAYREDLLIAVQDLLTYAMTRAIAKISTTSKPQTPRTPQTPQNPENLKHFKNLKKPKTSLIEVGHGHPL